MLHLVPLGKQRRILEPKVSGQIDHPDTGFEQGWGLRHGHAMRGREEHHVATGQCNRIGRRKFKIDETAQRGIHLIDAGAGLGSRRNDLQLRTLVGGQQTQQFDTGIASTPDDANLDLVHSTNSGKP